MTYRNSELLLKSGFKASLIEAIISEISNNINNYYYFLGDVLDREDEEYIEKPEQSVGYENKVRSNIVGMKKVAPNDITPVIPKIEWRSGEVFDMYDSGVGVTVMVMAFGTPGENIIFGDFDRSLLEIGMLAYGEGITVGSRVVDFGDNFIEMESPTAGVSVLTENFNQGIENEIGFVVTTDSGSTSLEDSNFYCVSNNNVYKCLSNNKASPSTVRPVLTISSPFTLEDGYTWKYMYTIPNPMRSKFYIGKYMPVTTSLSNRIYTRGTIPSVTIISYGADYPSNTAIDVLGDGFASGNRFKISGINITNAGSGYTTPPEIVIDSPLSNRGYNIVPFQPNTEVDTDDLVVHEGRIYQVMSLSRLGTTPPSHEIKETIYVGATPLKYVGRLATANAEISDGSVSGISLVGGIGFIYSDGGAGYDQDITYSVSITDQNPQASGASAFAVVQNGVVSSVVVTRQGFNYTNATVSIQPPYTHNKVLGQQLDDVEYGDIIKVESSIGDRFYQVSSIDEEYSVFSNLFLNHESGAVKITGVTYQFLGRTALASAEIYYGFGYYDVPSVTLSPPFEGSIPWEGGLEVGADAVVSSGGRFYRAIEGLTLGSSIPSHTSGIEDSLEFIGEQAKASIVVDKTKAKMSPIIENGQIVGVSVQDPGEGYNIASILVNGYPGYGAILTPNLFSGGINSTQSNIEISAVKGTIDSIKVKHTGSNIITIPSDGVKIVGDGSGATARAVFQSGGISEIIVTNKGSGYTWARVEINYVGGDSSTPPTARAIISPMNGHGSNAIRELFAKRVMISTGISLEANQGFTPKNKYRQMGIIKNPVRYDAKLRATDTNLSACYVITSDFNPNDMVEDAIFYDQNNNEFMVVSPPSGNDTDGAVSVLVISLSSAPLTEGMVVFVNNTPHRLRFVSNPTFDKFSGDLLFVDNRQAFLPTIDQVIMISSVINF